MSQPFRIVIPNSPLLWKELCWSDCLKLPKFWQKVTFAKARNIAEVNEGDWVKLGIKIRRQHEKEAKKIMYELRGIPLGINHLLPLIAAIGIPEILHSNHCPKYLINKLGRYHIALLWKQTSGQVLGVSTLERMAPQNTAELCFWKNPELDRASFDQAVTRFMAWSHKSQGYEHFVLHTDAATANQRGNPQAVALGERLGFKFVDIRSANDPKGNGKDTITMIAKDWPQNKKFEDLSIR